MLERLGLMVESRWTRSVLVGLIILSLVPVLEIEEAFRWLFVAAFGAELAVRVPLLIQRRRERRARIGELAFLIVDVAAFLSFLPLQDWLHEHFYWLRLLRLSRLLVLLRFARELANDIYSILTRREQLQQFALVTVAVAGLAFVSAVILSQLQISHDYDGIPERSEGFTDQIWWSFRQLESADNLVASLDVHPILGAVSLTLTVIGVFIISFIIGIGTNVVEQVVRAERRRAVGYSGHTVVVGPIEESEILVREFVRIYAKNRRDFRDQLWKVGAWLIGRASAPRAWRLPRMALLGPSSEPPPVLLERGMRWVVYRQGEGADVESLERIGADRAKRVILLGDRSLGIDADAATVATLAAVRTLNPRAHVFVELLGSRNHSTLVAVGDGARTFPLDVSWFLGLFLLHHVVIPGIERLYHYLLTADGSEFYSHVYRSRSELEAIAKLGEGGYVDSQTVASLGLRHGVVLVGVFLGEPLPEATEHDLIAMEGLVPWVNPHDEPVDPKVLALGGRAGQIPVDRIRGVIAVGETYQPVRAFARALADEPRMPPPEPSSGVEIGDAEPPPRQVLVVGYGDAIASFTHRLAELTAGAIVRVATDGGPKHARRLRSALSRAGLRLDETDGGATAELARGGRLEILADIDGDPMDMGLRILEEHSIDAVVFVAESDAADPDARTALRLMRLAEHLLGSEVAVPHVLAELSSLARGERVRLHVEAAFERAGRAAPRVTLVSTEQVRNYFMVHSAFVPGINTVYGQLLGEVGQDLVRLPLPEPRTLSLGQAASTLAERRFIPLGLETRSGEIHLNSDADERIAEVVGVFAIGEADSAWMESPAQEEEE